jgi:hypothetical protein
MPSACGYIANELVISFYAPNLLSHEALAITGAMSHHDNWGISSSENLLASILLSDGSPATSSTSPVSAMFMMVVDLPSPILRHHLQLALHSQMHYIK